MAKKNKFVQGQGGYFFKRIKFKWSGELSNKAINAKKKKRGERFYTQPVHKGNKILSQGLRKHIIQRSSWKI